VWRGFRDPATPIAERMLWRLTHSTSGKHAEARVWVMDQGRQLRLTIDGELMWSHLFDPPDVRELPAMSDECRARLERAGWISAPKS
jgi:hypothetical protein